MHLIIEWGSGYAQVSPSMQCLGECYLSHTFVLSSVPLVLRRAAPASHSSLTCRVRSTYICLPGSPRECGCSINLLIRCITISRDCMAAATCCWFNCQQYLIVFFGFVVEKLFRSFDYRLQFPCTALPIPHTLFR